MISLFAGKRNRNPTMLKIPAFCVTAEESAQLLSKREAQLEWMRAQGVQYILAAPVARHSAQKKRAA
jgi:hypothetical protein